MDAAVHASHDPIACEHCQVRVIAGAVFCASDCRCETCVEEELRDAEARALEDEARAEANQVAAPDAWLDELVACGVWGRR